MFTIWKTNLDVVCEAILALRVPCYAQALELLDAQKKAKGVDHSVFGYQSTIDRARWILEWAGSAARALACFEQILAQNSEDYPSKRKMLTPAERLGVIQAYYRAITLATHGTTTLPRRMMSSWDMLDLEQVFAFLPWSFSILRGDINRQPGTRAIMDVETDERWKTAFTSVGYFKKDLCELASQADRDIIIDPKQQTVFHGNYQPANKRGVRLADYFELIRRIGPHYNFEYTLSEE